MAKDDATQVMLDDEPLIQVSKKKRRLFFAILYGLFMMDFVARVGINAIFPVIQADLQLTDPQVGALGSVVLLGMAALVLPVSYLGEKFSPKKAISISALVWSLGSLLSGMASSFSLLICSRFMVGAGNSAYAPLSNSMITSMYPKSRWGKQIGIYNTAMTFGMAVGAIFFANIAAHYGWRIAFYAVGIASLLLTIASLILPDTKKNMNQALKGNQRAEVKHENSVTLKTAIIFVGKNKSLLGICLGASIGIMATQAILSWLAIYFVREMGMSVPVAASLVSISALVTALGYPLGGMVMDKWYAKDKRCRAWLPAICYTVCGLTFAAGFYFHLISILIISMIIYTMGNTSFHVATQELVPAWFKSVSYGVYVLFIQFLGAMGPLCAGQLSARYGLVTALVAMQSLFLVGAVILVLSGKIYMKDYHKARAAEQAAGCEACPE